MKKLLNALVLLLALNFLVAGGGVGWLFMSGHLDKDRVGEVKKILFPPPPDNAPASQPTTEPVSTASDRLAQLLAKHAGRPVAEQVEMIQQSFDATTAQLDRREREVADREQQVAAASARLESDRQLLQSQRDALARQAKQADSLAADKGFQDTLALYNTMPSKQAKGMFASMDEASAAEYLDAMEPRTAAKIMKEFKTTDESDRLKRILEKMRHPPGAAGPATQPS